MSKRLRVAVLAGGRSSEHDISVASARSVVAALDPHRFVVAVWCAVRRLDKRRRIRIAGRALRLAGPARRRPRDVLDVDARHGAPAAPEVPMAQEMGWPTDGLTIF